MTTFHQWFETQAGRGDDVGQAALTWVDAKGIRPKRFGVDGVLDWLREHLETIKLPEDRARAALAAAKAQFHEVGGNVQTTPLVAPLIGQAPAALQAAPGGAPPGWLPGDPIALPADAVYATPDAEELAAGDPPQVALLPQNLKRILEAIWQQGRENAGALSRIEQWQAQQNERIGPLERLLAELGEAETAADDLEGQPGYAEAGLVPGDGFPLAGPQAAQSGLYGGHIVDRAEAWEAAYQQSDPDEAG
jgi:hypothetical protein